MAFHYNGISDGGYGLVIKNGIISIGTGIAPDDAVRDDMVGGTKISSDCAA